MPSTAFRALAWSEVDDVPEIASVATESEAPAGLSAARPPVDFVPEHAAVLRAPKTEAWYRPILVTVGVFAAMVLVGTGAVMAIRNDASAMTGAATTTTTVAPGPAAPAAAPPAELAVTPEEAPERTLLHPGACAGDPRRGDDAAAGDHAGACACGGSAPGGHPPPPSAPPPSTPTTTPTTTSPAPSSPPPSAPPSSPPSSPAVIATAEQPTEQSTVVATTEQPTK